MGKELQEEGRKLSEDGLMTVAKTFRGFYPDDYPWCSVRERVAVIEFAEGVR